MIVSELKEVSAVKLGEIDVSKVMVGDKQVYPDSVEVPGYFRLTALESGTFSFTIGSIVSTSEFSSISYSLDEGQTWVDTNNVDNQEIVVTTPTIAVGESVIWKGSGKSMSSGTTAYSSFSSSGRFDVSGDILSLLYSDNFANYDNFDNTGNGYGVNHLFHNATNLVNANKLKLPNNVIEYCYSNMFKDCTSLVTFPILPANTLALHCYDCMFRGCTSLVSTPNLLATTLADYCYYQMFYGCTSLINVSNLSATTLTQMCYGAMFQGCTSLVTAPTLSALTLITGCYRQMFNGCSVLNYIKALFTTTPATSYTSAWVKDIAANGIFVKHIDASWTTTGNVGVPTNWTVIYYDPDDNKYYTDQTKTTECDDHGNPI